MSIIILKYTDLRPGMECFGVGVDIHNQLFFKGKFTINNPKFQETADVNIGEWKFSLKNRRYSYDDEEYAISSGLLIGTDIPQNLSDNWHRTFLFSEEAYGALKQVVEDQDFAGYENIVGKRLQASSTQKTKDFLMRQILKSTFCHVDKLLRN